MKIKEACGFQANHLMGYFDKNYLYRASRLSDTVCTIEARQNPDVLDALKVKLHGSRNVCDVKAGVAGSFPEFSAFLPGKCGKRNAYTAEIRYASMNSISQLRPITKKPPAKTSLFTPIKQLSSFLVSFGSQPIALQ